MDKILSEIALLLETKASILIGIDGRCGAGKTTLSTALQEQLDCNVIHMDDFFLQPHQRTAERLSSPGENVDHERFLTEVMVPLSRNTEFQYRPFDCKTMSFGNSIKIIPNKITIIEGSYSCHPKLWNFYDLHIFADIDKETQLQRIIARNGSCAAENFKQKWIPLEEAYFDAFEIKKSCEIVY